MTPDTKVPVNLSLEQLSFISAGLKDLVARYEQGDPKMSPEESDKLRIENQEMADLLDTAIAQYGEPIVPTRTDVDPAPYIDVSLVQEGNKYEFSIGICFMSKELNDYSTNEELFLGTWTFKTRPTLDVQEVRVPINM